MGCKLAFATLLRYNLERPIAGIIGICGTLPLTDDRIYKDEKSIHIQRQTPILILHGEKDSTTSWGDAKISYEYFINDIYIDSAKQNLKIEIDKDGTHSVRKYMKQQFLFI